MNSDLPATGTAALLELLDPFIPDDFINECWPHGRTGGRWRDYSSAQLYRIHLLSLLSPVHSVNLLVKLLPEQRAWRRFCGLRRQTQVPGVRVLHEFRCRVGVDGLWRINQHLLAPLVAGDCQLRPSPSALTMTSASQPASGAGLVAVAILMAAAAAPRSDRRE